jgi:hypothetical protein
VEWKIIGLPGSHCDSKQVSSSLISPILVEIGIIHARHVIATYICTARFQGIRITKPNSLLKQVGSLMIKAKVNDHAYCNLYVLVGLLTPWNKMEMEPSIGQFASVPGAKK